MTYCKKQERRIWVEDVVKWGQLINLLRH